MSAIKSLLFQQR